ncbi:nitroreductase [uncultured Shimia sp.]|uniref:nitroreductase n=1 Tax=uncultured Shimia sp. TaxID=573152 RepID=UPI00262A7BFB|nr:nitroreductase [uncultured Shimia sp.]
MTHHTALQSLLQDRFSCRGFKPDPLPADTIRTILGDAGRVPSWCNAQPWQVHVTSGAGTEAFRKVMLEAFDTQAPNTDFDPPKGYSGTRKERRQICGFQLYEAVGIARGDREARTAQMRENYAFFGAPHVALITSAAELGAYGALDCGGFITAFCLSAQAQGVATIPQAALAYYADTVRAHFEIPEDQLVLAAISFGFEDTAHPANGFRTGRATLDDMVVWHDT